MTHLQFHQNTKLGVFGTGSSSDAGGNGPAIAKQQYVQASPPYDLGDGEVHGFIFVLLERGSGKPLAVYSAAEAPWIYNGPTCVVPHRVDEEGRKFRSIQRRLFTLKDLRAKRTSLAEYQSSRIQHDEIELTQAHYHADMNLIPHPFGSYNPHKHVVILLDPMHELIGTLLNEQQEGCDVHWLIYDAHLKFDNVPLSRKGPQGVMQVALNL